MEPEIERAVPEAPSALLLSEEDNVACDAQPQEPVVQLLIEYRPRRGSVGVFGPIKDRFLCYAMLGMAEDIIRDEASNGRRIVVPEGNDLAAAILASKSRG